MYEINNQIMEYIMKGNAYDGNINLIVSGLIQAGIINEKLNSA